MLKRLTALMLVICMTMSLLPVQAFAAEDETQVTQVTEEVVETTEAPTEEPTTAPTEPEVTEPETTAPEKETEPEQTTAPTESQETTVPAESTEPEESTQPEETTEPEASSETQETTEPEEVPEEPVESFWEYTDDLGRTITGYGVVWPEGGVSFFADENLPTVTTEKDAAAFIRRGMVSRTGEIKFTYRNPDSKVTEDGFMEMIQALIMKAWDHTGSPVEGDYLERQWNTINFGYSYAPFMDQYAVDIILTVTYYTTAAQEREVDSAVASTLSMLNLNGKSEYQKIKAIYDFVTEHVAYDWATLEDESYKLKYTAYAALLNGTAVCQGYAVLMYRLLLTSGIDCRVVCGANHAWNIAKIGSYYYNLDSTWDEGRLQYGYDWFLLSEEDFVRHPRYPQYATPAFYAAYPMSQESYDPTNEQPTVLPLAYCGENYTKAVAMDYELVSQDDGACWDLILTLPEADSSRPDYRFLGWECGGVRYDAGQTVTLPVTFDQNREYRLNFIAVYEFTGDASAATAAVLFVGAGEPRAVTGSLVSVGEGVWSLDLVVPENIEIGSFPNNYKFGGWITDNSSVFPNALQPGDHVSLTMTPGQTLVFTMAMQSTQYCSVTFHDASGGIVKQGNIQYGRTMFVPTQAEINEMVSSWPADWTFEGWELPMGDGSVTKSIDGFKTVTRDLHFYPVIVTRYPITFQVENGSWRGVAENSVTVKCRTDEKLDPLDIPTPVADPGVAPLGWFDQNGNPVDGPDVESMVSGPCTYIYKFQPRFAVTVRYGLEPQTYYVDPGKTLSECGVALPQVFDPPTDGRKVMGWCLFDPDAPYDPDVPVTVFDPGAPVMDNVTIEPWEVDACVVHFGEYGDFEVLPGEALGDQLPSLDHPSFVGWFTSDGVEITADTPVAEEYTVVYPKFLADLTLELDRHYLILESGEVQTVQVRIPDEWAPFAKVSVETVTENGEVFTAQQSGTAVTLTAAAAGTAWLVVTVDTDGRFAEDRCRIDVNDGTIVPVQVKLDTASITTELYKTDYTRFRAFVELEQNVPAMFSLDAVQTAPMNNGAAITGAEFGVSGSDDLSELFDLVVLDDGWIQVVPKDNVVTGEVPVKSSYSKVPVIIYVGGQPMDPITVKLTVKKTAPKLKAKALSFNSFVTWDSHPLEITGGNVRSVMLDPDKKELDWVHLDGDTMILDPDAYGKYSGTVYLWAEVEGYSPLKLWPVSVSVKAAYTTPKVALSASAVTLYSGSRSQGLELALVSKDKKVDLMEMGLAWVEVPENYELEWNPLKFGAFTLTPKTVPQNGPIYLDVYFSQSRHPVPLKLSVKVADVAVKLAKTSLTLNPEILYNTPVGVTFTPGDFDAGNLNDCITITGKGTDDVDGQLDVIFKDGVLNVATTETTRPGYTYTIHIKPGAKETKLTVKTLTPDKKTNQVPVTATLKASGSIDLAFPGTEAVVRPTYKNYQAQGNEKLSYSITNKAGKHVESQFNVAFDADGAAHVTARENNSLDLRDQYFFSLRTVVGGSRNVDAKAVRISLKQTALSLKLSKSSISLNPAYGDSAVIQVTSGVRNYTLGKTLDYRLYDGKTPMERENNGQLNVEYRDGQLLVKTLPTTGNSKTFKIELSVPGNSKVTTLTVKTPAANKTAVTTKLKTAGSIDVLRPDLGITVTPTLLNFLGEAQYSLEIRRAVGRTEFEACTDDFVIEDRGDAFFITPGPSVDHTVKYQVRVNTTLGGIPIEPSAWVSMSVKMGSAKVTADKKAVTLYNRDIYSTDTIGLICADKTLSGIRDVQVQAAAGKPKPIGIRPLGGGLYEIYFTGDTVPTKAQKLTLKIFMEGNATDKANTTVSVTVNILK